MKERKKEDLKREQGMFWKQPTGKMVNNRTFCYVNYEVSNSSTEIFFKKIDLFPRLTDFQKPFT